MNECLPVTDSLHVHQRVNEHWGNLVSLWAGTASPNPPCTSTNRAGLVTTNRKSPVLWSPAS